LIAAQRIIALGGAIGSVELMKIARLLIVIEDDLLI
jgi:hypothetical protein